MLGMALTNDDSGGGLQNTTDAWVRICDVYGSLRKRNGLENVWHWYKILQVVVACLLPSGDQCLPFVNLSLPFVRPMDGRGAGEITLKP